MAGEDSTGKTISRLAERRPVDGALYMASHTRLADDVSLAIAVTTTEPGGLSFAKGSHLSPVGGEHRMASIETGPAVAHPMRPDKLNVQKLADHISDFSLAAMGLAPSLGTNTPAKPTRRKAKS